MLRRGTDRAVGLLAVVLVYVFHRSVDVRGRSMLPTDRPVLIVANHGNGFVDPIVVAAALRRLPAVPRQGGAVEGRRRSAVPRVRRGVAGVPIVGR